MSRVTVWTRRAGPTCGSTCARCATGHVATVLLTTHYLNEADALCDRILVINNGAIVAEGTPEELKQRVAGDQVTLTVEPADAAAATAAQQGWAGRLYRACGVVAASTRRGAPLRNRPPPEAAGPGPGDCAHQLLFCMVVTSFGVGRRCVGGSSRDTLKSPALVTHGAHLSLLRRCGGARAGARARCSNRTDGSTLS
jgi:hypothetical protein